MLVIIEWACTELRVRAGHVAVCKDDTKAMPLLCGERSRCFWCKPACYSQGVTWTRNRSFQPNLLHGALAFACGVAAMHAACPMARSKPLLRTRNCEICKKYPTPCNTLARITPHVLSPAHRTVSENPSS